MEKIFLDTDIGPDCDDAGAIAVLNSLAKRGYASVIGMTCCTSSIWGASCIEAINNFYYSDKNIPIGTSKIKGFLEGSSWEKYNKRVSESFLPKQKKSYPEAVNLMRSVLAQQEDQSITLVGIGPVNNISELINSNPDEFSPYDGLTLMRKKISTIVLMACWFEEIDGSRKEEWNVLQDIGSVRNVLCKWDGDLVFSGFEVGANIITGGNFPGPPDANPVAMSYHLHSPKGRPSWDLTAIYYAVLKDGEFFVKSGPGIVSVDENGYSTFVSDSEGRHYYLKLASSRREAEVELEKWLYMKP